MYALILNGVVVQISNEVFEVSPELSWVDISDNDQNIAPKHTYDGWNFSPPTSSISNVTPEQGRLLNYPSLHQVIDMLYNSMKIGEIPKSQDFFNTILNIQKQYPFQKTEEVSEKLHENIGE